MNGPRDRRRRISELEAENVEIPHRLAELEQALRSQAFPLTHDRLIERFDTLVLETDGGPR
jgi:hypothetical protein